jgi:hypothetical protein
MDKIQHFGFLFSLDTLTATAIFRNLFVEANYKLIHTHIIIIFFVCFFNKFSV